MKNEFLGHLEDWMPTIESNSVRMIWADFPFGSTLAAWDVPIDLEIFWKEANRILLENGVVLCKCQFPFTAVLAMSNLKNLRYDWVWEKPKATGFYNANKMPLKSHETILCFYKKLPVYNPQKTEGHKPVNSFTKKKEVADKCSLYGKNTKDIKGGGNTDRYPRSVQIFSSDTQKSNLHPNQCPEEMLEYFIKTYTNEGDTVLDPCRGSNTTGVVCDRLGRKYIGIEKDPTFYEIGIERRNGLI